MKRPVCHLNDWIACSAAVLLPLLVNCAARNRSISATGDAPPKVAIRFHLAAAEAREGYREFKDEQGLLLFVAPEPFLTEADVRSASLMSSPDHHMVLLEFDPLAADRLDQTTAENIGGRLAIFVDGTLLMSPLIRDRIAGGKAALSGAFTRERTVQIVESFNGAPPPPAAKR